MPKRVNRWRRVYSEKICLHDLLEARDSELLLFVTLDSLHEVP